jgi:hypothetical protein
VRPVSEAIVLATVSTLIDRCSTSTRRADQFHNVLIVEPYANLAQRMSDVTVAERRHIPKELVLTIVILRVSFSRDF